VLFQYIYTLFKIYINAFDKAIPTLSFKYMYQCFQKNICISANVPWTTPRNLTTRRDKSTLHAIKKHTRYLSCCSTHNNLKKTYQVFVLRYSGHRTTNSPGISARTEAVYAFQAARRYRTSIQLAIPRFILPANERHAQLSHQGST